MLGRLGPRALRVPITGLALRAWDALGLLTEKEGHEDQGKVKDPIRGSPRLLFYLSLVLLAFRPQRPYKALRGLIRSLGALYGP